MIHELFPKRCNFFATAFLFLIAASGASVQAKDGDGATQRWYKGNLHTHSLWSDGNDYPEMIIQWYKDHGYDFLSLSDHNVTQTVERWTSSTNKGGTEALERYVQKFGTNWVEQKDVDGST